MIVRPMVAEDIKKIELQSAQTYSCGTMEDYDFAPLIEANLAWAAEHEGEIVALGGFYVFWENRSVAWALLSSKAGPVFNHLHKHISRSINKFGETCRRIEITVDVGFDQGHRWAKMLGFTVEGYMRAFRPDGGDVILYAKVFE